MDLHRVARRERNNLDVLAELQREQIKLMHVMIDLLKRINRRSPS